MRKNIILLLCIISIAYICNTAYSNEQTAAGKSGSGTHRQNAFALFTRHIIDGFASMVGTKKEELPRQGHIAPTTPPPAQLGSYSLMPPRQKPSDDSMRKLLKDSSKK